MRPVDIRLGKIICVLDDDVWMIGKPGIYVRFKCVEVWLPVAFLHNK